MSRPGQNVLLGAIPYLLFGYCAFEKSEKDICPLNIRDSYLIWDSDLFRKPRKITRPLTRRLMFPDVPTCRAAAQHPLRLTTSMRSFSTRSMYC